MNQDAIAATLRARLADLEQRLARIREDAAQAHSSDSAEQAQERENDEVLDAIGNETAVAIASIRGALQRIEDGSYGICADCGEAIGEARLSTLPETTTCVQCKAAKERAG